MRRGVAQPPQTLGEHLRRVRIDRKLTNLEVAHILGVAYQTLEKWEHNRTSIGPQSRPKVVAFIGYDPEVNGSKSNVGL